LGHQAALITSKPPSMTPHDQTQGFAVSRAVLTSTSMIVGLSCSSSPSSEFINIESC
jgi:hypothetical protein